MACGGISIHRDKSSCGKMSLRNFIFEGRGPSPYTNIVVKYSLWWSEMLDDAETGL